MSAVTAAFPANDARSDLVRAPYRVQNASSVLPARRSMTSEAPRSVFIPSLAPPNAKPTVVSVHFDKGEHVQIWSHTRGNWMDANVTEVFSRAALVDGNVVEPGTVMVQTPITTKCIAPDRIATMLRKKDASGVWSAAVDAQTHPSEGSSVSTMAAGFSAGVNANVRPSKRASISTTEARERRRSPEPRSRRSASVGPVITERSSRPEPESNGGHGRSVQILAASLPQAVPITFSKGEQVQVWSRTRGTWMDAVVLETFPHTTVVDGLTVCAGTVYVESAISKKLIAPTEVPKMLRKLHAGPGAAVGSTNQLPPSHVSACDKPSSVCIAAQATQPSVTSRFYSGRQVEIKRNMCEPNQIKMDGPVIYETLTRPTDNLRAECVVPLGSNVLTRTTENLRAESVVPLGGNTHTRPTENLRAESAVPAGSIGLAEASNLLRTAPPNKLDTTMSSSSPASMRTELRSPREQSNTAFGSACFSADVTTRPALAVRGTVLATPAVRLATDVPTAPGEVFPSASTNRLSIPLTTSVLRQAEPPPPQHVQQDLDQTQPSIIKPLGGMVLTRDSCSRDVPPASASNCKVQQLQPEQCQVLNAGTLMPMDGKSPKGSVMTGDLSLATSQQQFQMEQHQPPNSAAVQAADMAGVHGPTRDVAIKAAELASITPSPDDDPYIARMKKQAAEAVAKGYPLKFETKTTTKLTVTKTTMVDGQVSKTESHTGTRTRVNQGPACRGGGAVHLQGIRCRSESDHGATAWQDTSCAGQAAFFVQSPANKSAIEQHASRALQAAVQGQR